MDRLSGHHDIFFQNAGGPHDDHVEAAAETHAGDADRHRGPDGARHAVSGHHQKAVSVMDGNDVPGPAAQFQAHIGGADTDNPFGAPGDLFKGEIAGKGLTGHGKGHAHAFHLKVGTGGQSEGDRGPAHLEDLVDGRTGGVDGKGEGAGEGHAGNVLNGHMGAEPAGHALGRNQHGAGSFGHADKGGGAVAQGKAHLAGRHAQHAGACGRGDFLEHEIAGKGLFQNGDRQIVDRHLQVGTRGQGQGPGFAAHREAGVDGGGAGVDGHGDVIGGGGCQTRNGNRDRGADLTGHACAGHQEQGRAAGDGDDVRTARADDEGHVGGADFDHTLVVRRGLLEAEIAGQGLAENGQLGGDHIHLQVGTGRKVEGQCLIAQVEGLGHRRPGVVEQKGKGAGNGNARDGHGHRGGQGPGQTARGDQEDPFPAGHGHKIRGPVAQGKAHVGRHDHGAAAGLFKGEITGEPLAQNGKTDAQALDTQIGTGRNRKGHGGAVHIHGIVHRAGRGVDHQAKAAAEGNAGDVQGHTGRNGSRHPGGRQQKRPLAMGQGHGGSEGKTHIGQAQADEFLPEAAGGLFKHQVAGKGLAQDGQGGGISGRKALDRNPQIGSCGQVKGQGLPAHVKGFVDHPVGGVDGEDRGPFHRDSGKIQGQGHLDLGGDAGRSHQKGAASDAQRENVRYAVTEAQGHITETDFHQPLTVGGGQLFEGNGSRQGLACNRQSKMCALDPEVGPGHEVQGHGVAAHVEGLMDCACGGVDGQGKIPGQADTGNGDQNAAADPARNPAAENHQLALALRQADKIGLAVAQTHVNVGCGDGDAADAAFGDLFEGEVAGNALAQNSQVGVTGFDPQVGPRRCGQGDGPAAQDELLAYGDPGGVDRKAEGAGDGNARNGEGHVA
ncbi:hypothetical protein [Desulfatiferula olefinivorans]